VFDSSAELQRFVTIHNTLFFNKSHDKIRKYRVRCQEIKSPAREKHRVADECIGASSTRRAAQISLDLCGDDKNRVCFA